MPADAPELDRLILNVGIDVKDTEKPVFGVMEKYAYEFAAIALVRSVGSDAGRPDPHALDAAVPVVVSAEERVSPTYVTFPFTEVAARGDVP